MGLWGRLSPVSEPETPPPLPPRNFTYSRQSSLTKIGYMFNPNKNSIKRLNGKYTYNVTTTHICI